MKKTVCLLIAFILMLYLYGCAKEEPSYPIATGDPIQSFDEEAFIEMPETVPIYQETSTTVLPPQEEITDTKQGFLIKYKKYTYNNSDILIMDITNLTEENYTVTVNGNFKNKDGKTIKTSRKSFQGWAAGYHNYFLFQPMVTFESFEYDFEAVKYNGECLAKYLEIDSFKKLELTYRKTGINGEYIQTGCVAVKALYPLKNTYKKELHYSAIFVVFDNQGRIHTLDSRLIQAELFPGDYPTHGRIILQSEILWPNKDKYELPDKLKGEVNGLMIIRKVSDTPLA